MSVDKDKVNNILLEFQNILKSFKPNTSELQLINSKISKMTAKNIEKQFSPSPKNHSRVSQRRSSPQRKKNWRKIKIN